MSRRLLLVVVVFMGVQSALAEDPPGISAPPADVASKPAPPKPPDPCTGDWDWIQLTSGEWLKGEIKDVLDDSFVFESDKLDTLKLDFEDIYAVHSPRTNTVMLKDRTVVEGTLRIEGDRVVATTTEGEREVTRDEVRSIIPGARTELNFWSGKLGLGASIRRGNIDQTDLSATFRLERRSPGTRLSMNYDGAYSVLEGKRTTNTHRASSTFDIYLTERLFLRPAQLTYFRDEFQNIDYRLTPSAGFGYELVDTSKLDWMVGAAAGWQFERVEAAPGGEIETSSSALLAFSRLEWEANSRVDVGYEFDLTTPTDNFSAFSFRNVIYTEVEIWDDFDLDVRLIWDRNNDPTPASDGTVPEQDDIQLYVGVSLDF